MSQNYYNGFKIGIVYKLSIHLFSHLFRMFRPNVTLAVAQMLGWASVQVVSENEFLAKLYQINI